MKTREQTYGQEATSILRDITMYRALTEEQLLRLYPGKRGKVQNLLSYLTKQGRIWHIDGLYCAAPECARNVDKGLLAAIWVLADFIDRVEFHSVGDFPAKLIFFTDGEVYEVIHAANRKETLINHILSAPAEETSSYLILVDKPEQIPELEIPNVRGYCRLRHLIYSTTSIKKEEYLTSAAVMQGIKVEENDGVLEITLPCLLPKRKQRQSTEYLLDPFTAAMSQYATSRPLPRFQHCVICFSHVYCQDLPERRVRDYDNLELKRFLDVAASFILTDGSGLLCDAYNTTELGETDCTRISIMDSKHFPTWLAERQAALQSITDF